MSSVKRITKELGILIKEPITGVEIKHFDENLSHWEIKIKGEGFYRGALIKLSIDFPAEYPFKPPTVKFLTKLYHPNIDEKGAVCMASLKPEAWKPATQMKALLQGLISLLSEPNPDDPLDANIAEVYRSNRPVFEKTAQEWVKKYANK